MADECQIEIDCKTSHPSDEAFYPQTIPSFVNINGCQATFRERDQLLLKIKGGSDLAHQMQWVEQKDINQDVTGMDEASLKKLRSKFPPLPSIPKTDFLEYWTSPMGVVMPKKKDIRTGIIVSAPLMEIDGKFEFSDCKDAVVDFFVHDEGRRSGEIMRNVALMDLEGQVPKVCPLVPARKKIHHETMLAAKLAMAFKMFANRPMLGYENTPPHAKLQSENAPLRWQSFMGVERSALAVIRAFLSHDINSCHVVGVMGKTTIDHATLLLALLLGGYTVVEIPHDFDVDQIANVICECELDVIFSEHANAQTCQQASASTLRQPRVFLNLGDAAGNTLMKWSTTSLPKSCEGRRTVTVTLKKNQPNMIFCVAREKTVSQDVTGEIVWTRCDDTVDFLKVNFEDNRNLLVSDDPTWTESPVWMTVMDLKRAGAVTNLLNGVLNGGRVAVFNWRMASQVFEMARRVNPTGFFLNRYQRLKMRHDYDEMLRDLILLNQECSEQVAVKAVLRTMANYLGDRLSVLVCANMEQYAELDWIKAMFPNQEKLQALTIHPSTVCMTAPLGGWLKSLDGFSCKLAKDKEIIVTLSGQQVPSKLEGRRALKGGIKIERLKSDSSYRTQPVLQLEHMLRVHVPSVNDLVCLRDESYPDLFIVAIFEDQSYNEKTALAEFRDAFSKNPVPGMEGALDKARVYVEKNIGSFEEIHAVDMVDGRKHDKFLMARYEPLRKKIMCGAADSEETSNFRPKSLPRYPRVPNLKQMPEQSDVAPCTNHLLPTSEKVINEFFCGESCQCMYNLSLPYSQRVSMCKQHHKEAEEEAEADEHCDSSSRCHEFTFGRDV